MPNLYQEVIFWALFAITVFSALLVVGQRDMFRSALALIVTFLAIAGIFAQMNAEFLADAQVLIYVGAVSDLVIFAVMFTKDMPHSTRSTNLQPVSIVVVGLLFIALCWAIFQSQWNEMPAELPAFVESTLVDSSSQLGTAIIRDYVMAFETVGVLLLAAVVGALALVRDK